MLPEEYIIEQIKTLKQLFLWKYMSDADKEQLRRVKTEDECSTLMRRFRDKYYEQMLEEYEWNPIDEYLDIHVLDMGLKTKTTNALMRKGLYTSEKAVEFIKEYGWSSIPLFGAAAAKDLYIQIYDELSEEEIDKLVKKTKIKENELWD